MKTEKFWRVEIVGEGEKPSQATLKKLLSLASTDKRTGFLCRAYVVQIVGKVAAWKAIKKGKSS